MKLTIHRGADEIGGNCIELEHDGRHLLLDMGMPLAASAATEVPLPPVPGLELADPRLVGVVLSHSHEDHVGQVRSLPHHVPLYVGEAAHRILAEAAFWTPGGLRHPATGFLRHRTPIRIGPFEVTPYLVDHSAFDAYALLIEAGGQRVFYTGDFRGHGRKAGLFEELLRAPPRDIDVLLMEGTNVRATGPLTERGASERDVEVAAAATCQATTGLVLAAYSAQNIDRLVTLYRAALRAGRELVMDLYTASIAAATGLSSIPQAHWDRVRVYLPRAQRRRVIRARAFARTDAVRAHRIYAEELAARPRELLMTFRASMLPELEDARCLDRAALIWSLWPGYLRQPSGTELLARLATLGLPMVTHHASGHAAPADLTRLVDALRPRRVVPIHSAAVERFAELFSRVEPQHAGQPSTLRASPCRDNSTTPPSQN